jgi:hypothetical protein
MAIKVLKFELLFNEWTTEVWLLMKVGCEWVCLRVIASVRRKRERGNLRNGRDVQAYKRRVAQREQGVKLEALTGDVVSVVELVKLQPEPKSKTNKTKDPRTDSMGPASTCWQLGTGPNERHDSKSR